MCKYSNRSETSFFSSKINFLLFGSKIVSDICFSEDINNSILIQYIYIVFFVAIKTKATTITIKSEHIILFTENQRLLT